MVWILSLILRCEDALPYIAEARGDDGCKLKPRGIS